MQEKLTFPSTTILEVLFSLNPFVLMMAANFN